MSHKEWPMNYQVGDGWVPLVEELAEKLSKVDPDYKITQIKEKFGGLRFYVQGTTDEGWDLINKYESKSYTICEDCGDPGKIVNTGWVRTLCTRCATDMNVIT